jgi:hypothetical protein
MNEHFLYTKAFNAGYLLEKFLPQLAKLLTSNLSDSDNDFAQGFIAGSKQYIQEKAPSKSKLLEKLKQDAKSSNTTPSKDKEKGIDKDI